MSDGLSETFRSGLAAERRHALFQSVAESLKDWDDPAKRNTAVNDIMAFEKWLLDVNPGLDRETGAMMYLDSLKRQDRRSWAALLAFALRHDARSEIKEIKALSPFRNQALVIFTPSESGGRLSHIADLTETIQEQLEGFDVLDVREPMLIAMDISVEEILDVKS